MIPFFDLAAQQAVIKRQIDENISKVLAHGKYILGPEVTELEDKLCEYTGAKYCITCANGTDALQIALMAIGVGPGDEVITPAFSYIAAAEAISLLGATPVYLDVSMTDFNIDVTKIEESISKLTKAIIPVSLFGQPADMEQINALAGKHGICVIEDAAQSFGSSFKGQKSCSLSDIACTSFFPTKPLGCYGDGGAIFTSDENIALQARKIARHGQSRRYQHDVLGCNSRLDTIQASILLPKLSILDLEIKARNQLSEKYNSVLKSFSAVNIQDLQPGIVSARAQYTVAIPDRASFMEFFNECGIPTTVHYPTPVNKQKAVKNDITFNVSEYLSRSVVSLPMHAYMTEKDLGLILRSLRSYFERISNAT